ncbi:hypothetical protein MM59RIKEN_09950 [Pusillibacter faecalis]|uniref:ABC-2 type transporter transmembrane domain-containing protein n=1 Tax=Pusillibacter faecalis TaxID=2714358 RepID=A0A810QD09_9FIRM|nr:ABC transporter permease [Pusillibacter faecalis]BCK83676.1 hypothetical protein MM59RIKEN_09950 [Pusillibacter faecalis]
MSILLKNNFERIKHHKAVLLIACIIMPLLICAAVFISNHSTTQEVIAVSGGTVSNPISCDQYTFVHVDQEPALSTLVDGTYAAYAQKRADGTYAITTLKGQQDKEAIMTLLSTGKLPEGYKGDDAKRSERGIGTNVLGFITMLVLMQGVALTTLYPEDRLKGTFRRIMFAPCNENQYLTAQFIFTLTCLYVPTFAAIAVIHGIFGVEIGFPIAEIAVLLLLLTVFATAFALFIATAFDRNTNLVATGISVVTCIVAGCFVDISTNNPILTTIFKIIPQTEFMELVHGVEFGGSYIQF